VSQLGSIAAGGRYDNLVGMFSSSGQQTPCVGVSIGVERVFTIMERKATECNLTAQLSDVQVKNLLTDCTLVLSNANVKVYVASIGAGYVPDRMRIAKILWKNNIPTEYSHLENPKFKKQLDEALERYIPVMVVFGEDELQRRVVKVKNMKGHVETEVELTEEALVQAVLLAGAKQCMTGLDSSLIDSMR
jgi:histidyl-tRNA synthetase